jgi:hypothetical protein
MCSPPPPRTQNRRTGVLDEPQNRRARRTAEPACSTNRRTGVLDDVKDASLAPRSGGLRPSPTSSARAGGRILRRGAGTRRSTTGVSRTSCRSHPSWATGVALRVEGVPRNASITPSWTRARHVPPPSRGRGRSRTRCSTSASRSGGALRCERLQHTDRRRTFRWCSSPRRLVTS